MDGGWYTKSMDDKCKKCGKEAEGYKCPDCDVESATHDPEHVCGGNRCMPKCKDCNEAEEKCSC